jgi:hypothetical protein
LRGIAPVLLATIADDAKNPTYKDAQLDAGALFVLKELQNGLHHRHVL